MGRLSYLFISIGLMFSDLGSYAQVESKNAIGLEVGRMFTQLIVSGPRYVNGGNVIVIPELTCQRDLSKYFSYRSAIGYTYIATPQSDFLDHGQHGFHTKQGIDFKLVSWSEKYGLSFGVAGYIAYQKYKTTGNVRNLKHYKDYNFLLYQGDQWYGGWEIAVRLDRKFSDKIWIELSPRLGFTPNNKRPLYRNYLTGFGHRLGSGDNYLKHNRKSGNTLDIYPGFDVRMYYSF